MMKPHLSTGFWALLAPALLILAPALLFPSTVRATEESGWITIVSDVIGDDSSCGAGKVKHELVLRNLDTDELATVPNATIESFDLDTDATVDEASGSGVSTVGPVCFDPESDGLEITIPGSDSYYPFKGGYTWDPASFSKVPREKFMRTTVWLRPKSNAGFDYSHIDPSGAYLNVSPTYKIVLDRLPTKYGATAVHHAAFFVKKWPTGESIVSKSINLSGGVGTKTIPAQTLPDGVYTWLYYLALNGNNDLGGGFNVLDLLVTQRSGYNAPFVLDTTLPSFTAATTHLPTVPYQDDVVTVSGAVTDNLSGITEIQVWVDGALAKTCPYFHVASASCDAPVGPFPAGSTHSYYAVAIDGAGNVATSPEQNFIVGTRGVCGPAHGVQTWDAPTGPANLCTLGTASSDPAVYNGSAGLYEWTCDGSDGLPATIDDAICSAPKDSFKICLDSCDSGSADFSGATIVLAPSETRNLRLCRNVSSVCDTAAGDLTADPLTVFDDTDAPADAVALTVTAGQVQAHSAASGASEAVNVTYSGILTSVTFSVPNICIKDCGNASNVCRGQTFDDANGCGTANCAGTRNCDFNWKEVTPGQ